MDVTRIRELCLAARDACDNRDFESARTSAREALRVAGSSADSAPHHARGMALVTLALVEHEAGATPEAEAAMAGAAAEARALEASDFENAAFILEAAARLQRRSGREGEARRLGAELVAWHARHLGDDHPRYFARRLEWLPS